MKERDWIRFLEEQAQRHDKVLFTLTELLHASRTTRAYTKLQVSRLVARGMLARHAHGLYGLPGPLPAEMLASAIDPTSYVTGSHALNRHGIVTQAPVEIDCFTLMPRARRRLRTSAGVFVFTTARPPVYAAPHEGHLAGPEQAACDFLWLCARRGVAPEQAVTWRNHGRLRPRVLREVAQRYPDAVRRRALRLAQGARAPAHHARSALV